MKRMRHLCACVAAVLIWLAALMATPQTSADLQLKYALIVTRHGVRSPTWTPERLDQYSAEPWPDWKIPPGTLTDRGRVLMKMMGEFYREYFASRRLLAESGCEDTNR